MFKILNPFLNNYIQNEYVVIYNIDNISWLLKASHAELVSASHMQGELLCKPANHMGSRNKFGMTEEILDSGSLRGSHAELVSAPHMQSKLLCKPANHMGSRNKFGMTEGILDSGSLRGSHAELVSASHMQSKPLCKPAAKACAIPSQREGQGGVYATYIANKPLPATTPSNAPLPWGGNVNVLKSLPFRGRFRGGSMIKKTI
jgi:hypothetical protein